MRKGINCRIYYTASTVPRTGKVRLLVWHAVWQSMGLLGVHSEKNQGFKLQTGQIHTTNLWWLPCITVHTRVPWQHVWACFYTIRHSSHWPISFFEFGSNATPRCSSLLGCSDLWYRRLKDHVPCRQSTCLQPNLSWGWEWCRPGLRGVQYRHVLSVGIHQDVLQQDCKLPKLFNHGLIRTIVSQETRLPCI